MERMKFAEELVREFLVFRGFTNTLHAFEKELATDIGKRFEVDKILDLIFSVYIPKFEAEKLIDLLTFFSNCFSYADSNLTDVISKLNQSILRYYVVYALKCGRKDKVLDFFGDFGNDLMRRDESWTSWFAVPYLQNPHLDPQFRVYFSEEWFRALDLSLRNFLSDMLNGTRTPALLKISAERDTLNRLKQEIKDFLTNYLKLRRCWMKKRHNYVCQGAMKQLELHTVRVMKLMLILMIMLTTIGVMTLA